MREHVAARQLALMRELPAFVRVLLPGSPVRACVRVRASVQLGEQTGLGPLRLLAAVGFTCVRTPLVVHACVRAISVLRVPAL